MILKEELVFLNSLKEYPKDNNYEVIIKKMLLNIGVIDSELRDNLIYTTFSKLIVGGFLTEQNLRFVLTTILDDQHLFYKIGEKDSDSVFTRSFSVLLIPLLLTFNKKQNFLSESEILFIKDETLRYLNNEKDYRGHVPEKGWAHAPAHGADALNALAKCKLNSTCNLEILYAVKKIICTKETVFTNLEDERFVTAVVTILKENHFEREVMENWLDTFFDWDKSELWDEEYKIISNVKLFLGSLYFRLSNEQDYQEIAKIIQMKITEMISKYI
ncbi:DUF2785 domain-containing protein [Solibacillus cecembensis]|uniref:DUF2785 domain-containing protein n=1 Tax=Solibacillus cecembensis TaxID=459347 RepID=UPI003D05417D